MVIERLTQFKPIQRTVNWMTRTGERLRKREEDVPLGHTNLIKDIFDQGRVHVISNILDDKKLLEQDPALAEAEHRVWQRLYLERRMTASAEETAIIDTPEGILILEELLRTAGLNQSKHFTLAGEILSLQLLNETSDKSVREGLSGWLSPLSPYDQEAIVRTLEKRKKELGHRKKTATLLLLLEAFLEAPREGFNQIVDKSVYGLDFLPASYREHTIKNTHKFIARESVSEPLSLRDRDWRVIYFKFYHGLLKYLVFTKAADKLLEKNPKAAKKLLEQRNTTVFPWSGWENFDSKELTEFIQRVNSFAVRKHEESGEQKIIDDGSLSEEQHSLLIIARNLFNTTRQGLEGQVDVRKLIQLTQQLLSFHSSLGLETLFSRLGHGLIQSDQLQEMLKDKAKLNKYLFQLLLQSQFVIDYLTGGQELSLIDLSRICQEVTIRLLYDQEKIKLRYTAAREFPLLIGKKGDWELVFFNLFENALKAVVAVSELRHGFVDIDFFVDPKKEALLITAEDNGIGIPKQLLENGAIFQGVSGFERQGIGGTGVGLPHIKEIVEKYGGRIDIESEEGKGTKVIIRLPLKT